MGSRTTSTFVPLLLLLILGSAQVASSSVKVELDRGLRAIEAGGPVPLTNRPLDHSARLAAQLRGREAVIAPVAFVTPDEFSVLFEFDGTRADLEASGIRVVTQAGRVFTARVRRGEMGVLRAASGLRNIQLARYTEPHMNLSVADTRADLEHAGAGSPAVYGGRAGAGLIIGDIDTGIDFTRPDFNDASGATRILAIWDQTDALGPFPSGFVYGTEWTQLNINTTPGLIRQVDSNGHGTLVSGVLAGNGSITGCSQPGYRFVGMAPLAQLITVKTDFTDAGIIDGVNYVFQKAAALGKNAVVNLSLGNSMGPHDGSGQFSTAISALTGPGRIIVSSAGNRQGSPIHGRLTTTSATVGTDRFTVSVPNYTAAAGTFNDYVLVTGWTDPTSSYTIRVKGPNATDTLSCGFGTLKDRVLPVLSTKGGKLYVSNSNAHDGFGGTATGRQFEVEIYDSLSANTPRNGTWEIDVVSNNAASLGKRVDIWVYGSSLGATGLEAPVVTGLDNTTLVGSPADGDSVIAVGAYTTRGAWTSCSSGGCAYLTPPTIGDIGSFSCVGPRRDGVIKPEITAPGVGIGTTHSSQAAAIGFCADVDDGAHEITQGTSFSSPHVAGAIALFLQYLPNATPSAVKQAFEAHARSDAFTGAVPNNTWGYGKLDVYATIDHVAPVATLTSPAGGEDWAKASSHPITWTASDNVAVTNVDLALSTDGGLTYPTSIALGAPNTGSYAWTVPGTITTQSRVRVTAHDSGNNSGTGASAANFTISDAALSVPPSQPVAFAIGNVRPNPMTGSVRLRIDVPHLARVRVSVVDLQGREVQRLASGAFDAGRYDLSWDGQTARGRAASGLYFLRFETPNHALVQRLVVAR